jgi:hypothetical protein
MTCTAAPPVGQSPAASRGLLVDPGAWLLRGVVEPFLSAMILARRDSAVRRADSAAFPHADSGRLNV